jgi:hypothetical protein
MARGGPAEEIDEHAVLPRVLVGQDTDDMARAQLTPLGQELLEEAHRLLD